FGLTGGGQAAGLVEADNCAQSPNLDFAVFIGVIVERNLYVSKALIGVAGQVALSGGDGFGVGLGELFHQPVVGKQEMADRHGNPVFASGLKMGLSHAGFKWQKYRLSR